MSIPTTRASSRSAQYPPEKPQHLDAELLVIMMRPHAASRWRPIAAIERVYNMKKKSVRRLVLSSLHAPLACAPPDTARIPLVLAGQ